MRALTPNQKIFYVYVLYRADGTTPMYVGKGKGERWLNHERDSKHYNKHLYYAIQQILAVMPEVPKKKLAEFLTEEEALLVEVQLIAEIGRFDLGFGSLLNLTNGGDGSSGYCHTDNAKLSMSLKRQGKAKPSGFARKISLALSGKKKSIEHCQKMREANLGKKLSEEVKANIGKGVRLVLGDGRMAKTEKWRKNMSLARLGKKQTPESNRKRSETLKGRSKSDEWKRKIGLASTGRTHSEETRQKISVKNKGKKRSEETKKNQVLGQLRRWERYRAEKAAQAKDA